MLPCRANGLATTAHARPGTMNCSTTTTFVLYATDLARCPVEGAFTGAQVEAAIKGHVLAEARLTGTYSLNPGVS